MHSNSNSNSSPSQTPIPGELRVDEWRYLPGIYDALRAITFDAPGQWINRHDLGRELCFWIGRNGKPIPSRGTLNRVLKRAGYSRGRIGPMQVVHGLQLSERNVN